MDEKIMMKFASALSISHERVLLQELNHRINNEFFSAMNLVSLAAARSGSHEVKVALAGVTDLLHHYAELHRSCRFRKTMLALTRQYTFASFAWLSDDPSWIT